MRWIDLDTFAVTCAACGVAADLSDADASTVLAELRRAARQAAIRARAALATIRDTVADND